MQPFRGGDCGACDLEVSLRPGGEGQQKHTGYWFPHHTLHYTARLHHTSIPNNTLPNPSVSFSSRPYFTLPRTTLYFTLYDTTLHCTIIYYTTHYTSLHHTILHYTTPQRCSVALHLNTKQYLPYRNLHYPFIPYRTLPTLHTTLHYTTTTYYTTHLFATLDVFMFVLTV